MTEEILKLKQIVLILVPLSVVSILAYMVFVFIERQITLAELSLGILLTVIVISSSIQALRIMHSNNERKKRKFRMKANFLTLICASIILLYGTINLTSSFLVFGLGAVMFGRSLANLMEKKVQKRTPY